MADAQQPQEDIIVIENAESVDSPKLIPPPSTSPPFDIREWVASLIAAGLFLLFAFTIAYPIWRGLSGCTPSHELLSFIETSIAHEVILLGIILAFYFSERRQQIR